MAGELRLPDFIIGGAPRSGTTWLYQLLDRHPEVYMAKPVAPEPKFFLVDHLYSLGIEHYARTWFSETTSAKVLGEKSANYLESAATAARVHKHLPAVKLVFVLREPVDRAFSNYCWSYMNGMEHEDFGTALELEEERERTVSEKHKFARPHAFFSRGLYADMLKPWYDRFSREQILILRYETVMADGQATAKRLHEFLGVQFRPGDVADLGVINPSKKQGHVMPEEIRQMLLERYREPNRRLAELLGPEFEIW